MLTEEFRSRLPLLAAVLARSNQTRASSLASYQGGARFRGIEESLDHIDVVRAIVQQIPDLTSIGFLIDRARADVEVGVEAALAGYPSVTSDAMRDLMEIEFLIWDLSLDKERIPAWLNADDKSLRRDYAPAAVRTRLKKHGAWNVGSKGESLDYQAHSAGLHVTPRDVVFKHGFESDDLMRDAAFWELFEHLRRLFEAFVLMRAAFPHEAWADMKELNELQYARDAWARTRQMQEMFLASSLGWKRARIRDSSGHPLR